MSERTPQMREKMLPYGRHQIEADDIEAVSNVLRSDWLTTGPTVEAFEKALADTVGAAMAVACSSGTAALHMAAAALELGAGDKCIVPALTFVASANGPHYAGAEIVFADVDPATGLLTADRLEAALSRAGDAVKAIIVVHLNGQQCDMPALAAVARGIPIIEDACHALGTIDVTREGERVPVGACRHSAMTCFSFHPVKVIAMGEGGAVTTNDATLAERLRRFRSHGIVRSIRDMQTATDAFASDGSANPWYYEMPAVGLNYRVSDIHCALGLSQLRKFQRFAAVRRELVAAYDRRFARFPAWARPIPHVAGCDAVRHLYVLAIDYTHTPGGSRAEVMRSLAALGIGTQVHYYPVHRQPYYARRYAVEELQGADLYYSRALSIPLFPAMNIDDVERVAGALEHVLGIEVADLDPRR
jgi:UDP-4-amino-4,6-dideoxy-N-acetyl-beta-L-altrosamine transaminase